MATFISKNLGFKVWGEKGEWNASFAPLGRYTTEDKKILEVLRAHPYYNKSFTEAGTLPKSKGNTIQGVRTSVTQGVLDKDNKLLRLGGLRARLLKNDGSRRKDASDEDFSELLELQGELGI